MKGTLVRNEESLWFVEWVDPVKNDTRLIELSRKSNALRFLKNNESRLKPLVVGLKVDFVYQLSEDRLSLYAELIFPEVEEFEKKQERMKNLKEEWLKAREENPEFHEYVRLAMRILGWPVTEYGSDLMCSVMDALVQKGGDLSVDEITALEVKMQEKYKTKTEEE